MINCIQLVRFMNYLPLKLCIIKHMQHINIEYINVNVLLNININVLTVFSFIYKINGNCVKCYKGI